MTDLSQTIGHATAIVAATMVDGGLTQEEADIRAACKKQESVVWLKRAAIFASIATVLALAIGGSGLYVITKLSFTGTALTVLIAVGAIFGVALLLVAGLPALAALLCATQASSELVRTTLGFLPAINKLPFIGKLFPAAP